MTAKTHTIDVAELPDARRVAMFEKIAARAYEIHTSGADRGVAESWIRAERELNSELLPDPGQAQESPANAAA